MSIKTYKKSILWVNRPILLQIQMLRITDLLTEMIPIMSLHKWITYTIKTIKLKISRLINQSRNERWYYKLTLMKDLRDVRSNRIRHNIQIIQKSLQNLQLTQTQRRQRRNHSSKSIRQTSKKNTKQIKSNKKENTCANAKGQLTHSNKQYR